MRKTVIIFALLCGSTPSMAETTSEKFCQAIAIDTLIEKQQWLSVQGQVVEASFHHKHSPTPASQQAVEAVHKVLLETTKNMANNATLWTAYCKK